jgi:hypothetical protein
MWMVPSPSPICGSFQSVTTGAVGQRPPRPMEKTRPSGAMSRPCGSPIWSSASGWLGWVIRSAW